MGRLNFAIFFASDKFSVSVPTPVLAPSHEIDRPFGDHDVRTFASPSKAYYSETWFHFIDGNIAKEGIIRNLEAIAG